MAENVVLISIDDMINVVRYRDAFGIQIQTPNIDRLMGLGVTFENAVTPVPICSPARTATLTAQSPFSTGVHDNSMRIQDVVPIQDTFLGAAHSAGFFTWSQGKVIHNPNNKDSKEYLAPVLDYQGQGGIRPQKTTDVSYPFDDVAPISISESRMEDTVTASAAQSFLTNYAGADPFFMAVGIYKPHLHWKTPEKYYDLYPMDDIDLPAIDGVGFEDLPEFFQNVLGLERDQELHPESASWPELIQAYLAAISYADAQIGRVLDGITAGGHWDDTTVVLFSDHGFHLGDRDIWRKFTLWEEAASIPMIIADPSLDAGTVVSTPASLIDIWPTLSGLTGLPEPVETQGVDLFSDHGREAVLTTTYGSISMRTETHRYTLYTDGEEELFSVDDITYAAPIDNPDPAVLADLRDQLVAEMHDQFGVDVVTDRMRGTEGDDVFIVIGDAKAIGDAGDDVFFVSDDAVIRAGSGYDTAIVTAEKFTMTGNLESAQIANRTSGRINGNDLDNDIFGGRGRDVLLGRDGRDYLNGNDGDDRLKGGQGGDVLNGGAGTDRLKGGAGRDKLIGGDGNDVFIFKSGWGEDRVRDFENNVDRLRIDRSLAGDDLSKAEILDAHASDTEKGVLFDFGDDTLLVVGVSLDGLKDDLEFI